MKPTYPTGDHATDQAKLRQAGREKNGWYIRYRADGEVGKGVQVIGNGGNTGVTAGQVGMAGSKTTGEAGEIGRHDCGGRNREKRLDEVAAGLGVTQIGQLEARVAGWLVPYIRFCPEHASGWPFHGDSQ